jgi:hypothetical protein
MESIIGLYKTDCLRPGPFLSGLLKTVADVEFATMDWVDWWNNSRLHSSIGNIPPTEAEAEHHRLKPAPRPAALTTGGRQRTRDASGARGNAQRPGGHHPAASGAAHRPDASAGADSGAGRGPARPAGGSRPEQHKRAEGPPVPVPLARCGHAAGLVNRNVCTLIDAPTPRTQEAEPLTREVARRLLAAASTQRNAARWVLALAVGLRQGKALALAWLHIDLDAGTMAIRQSMTRARYAHGCGRPPTCGRRPVDCPQRSGHGPELSDVKSRAGRRVVTLPAPLVVALRGQRTVQLQERLAAGSLWSSEPPAPTGMSWDLVSRQADGRPVGHKRDHAEWKALLAEAEAEAEAGVRDARLHDARHTAAG